MTRLCYVYAIQVHGAPLRPEVKGFDAQALFTVPQGDLQAVVSYLDCHKLRATEDNVLQHEAVVEAVRDAGPAIPVRFGTLIPDTQSVQEALSNRYAILVKDMERLGDKVEMGVTVLWNQPSGEVQAGQDDSPVAQTPGARYLRARYAQYRQNADLLDLAVPLVRSIDNDLATHALERRLSLLPTRRLLMRAAYLMLPANVREFQECFDEHRTSYPDLHFLLTGPWPPYSFVTPTDAGGSSGLDTLLRDMTHDLRTAGR